MIADRTTGSPAPPIQAVVTGETILQMRALAREVPLAPNVREFAIKLVLEHTRTRSTRRSRSSSLCATEPTARRAGGRHPAKIRALLAGRYNVAIEDIVQVAMPALATASS